MIVIRLTRVGKKNSPAYRVVVADKRRAVKRKFIEILGNYNPTRNPKELVINKERAFFWMERGAQPSPTIRNLMADAGVLSKSDKVNIVYGKEKSKKAIKEDAGKKPEIKTEEPTEPTETTSEQTEESKTE
ncbi:MAG: 30S ribosomal protein S16 [Patescibacteria group bacterium]